MNDQALRAERGAVLLAGCAQDGALLEAICRELEEMCEVPVELLPEEIPVAERGRLRRRLRGAALVVLAVTEHFVNGESAARSVVLPMARQEQVQLLPIAAQEGLEEAFHKLCPGQPLLSRYELAYPLRLQAWLEDRMELGRYPAGGAEDRKIRKSLFALRCLFLYAEADAPLAWRMEDWFHAREDTWDIALRSGPLQAGIDRAGEADLIFLLAAPGALRQGDALGELYARADEAEKPLLAISPEAECTDALLALCPGARERILPPDPAALHRAIAIWRERLGRPYGKLSPLVRTLLGEAYQLGRETDRNRALARRLYASAAEDSCAWAMLRLGLESAGQERLSYLRKAAPYFRELLYGTSPRSEEAVSVGRAAAMALERLSEVQREAGRLEDARLSLEGEAEAIEYLRQVGWRSERFSMGSVYAALGDIDLQEDHLPEAERQYRQAEALLRSGRQPSVSLALLLERLSLLYERAFQDTGSPSALERLQDTLEEALDMALTLDGETGYRAWRDEARLANRLLKTAIATEEQPQGAFDARELYDQACQALSELRRHVSQPILEEQYGTALCYRALAEEGAPDKGMLYEAHRVFKTLTDRYPHSAELRAKLEYVTRCLTIWPRLP